MRSIAHLAALAAFLLPASCGFAQVVYDTPGGKIPTELATGPYNEWPRTTTATPTGVNSSATGTAMVTAPNGTKIPVPVTATATVPQSALAKAAAKRAAAAALGPAAAAATAATVAEELLDPGDANSEWLKCGFMDLFLCKRTVPGGGAPTTFYVYNWSGDPASYHATGQGVCDLLKPKATAWAGAVYLDPGAFPWAGCYKASPPSEANLIMNVGTAQRCAPGGTAPDTSKPLGEQCGPVVPGEPVPATEAEIEQSLQEKMDADYEAGQRLWEALKRDQAAVEAANQQFPSGHDPVNADTPMSVNAPPVTSPERTTKVETIPRSDGSTDTATTKETTTVDPQTTGTKYGDTKTTFPSKTTSTTTVVNNVTNNTTVTTTVVNHPVMQAEDGPHPDLPDDYAREKTLQETRDALKTAGAADMADQGAVVEASKTKNDADLDTLFSDSETGVDADKARFFSWVWTPPVGVCAPFAGTVHGYEISWDLCPTIENINAVIGWLFALFSAMTVYGQLFKRND